MSRVVVCVEANQVALEDAKQQLLANRKDTVDLAAGERSMQEEANLDVLLGVADFLAQHLGQQHQVVIVDPNEVAILDILDHLLGEQTVDLLVGFPGGLVKCDLAGVVMEKRPENRVFKCKC